MSRICLNLDRGVFQNDTLDGPALDKDGSLADQDKIREELHEKHEEKGVCHIFKGEKYCHCETGNCKDWGEVVAEQILAAPKREIERSEEARKEGLVIPRYGFACELLQGTQAGRELLKNIEDGKTFEELQEILREKKIKEEKKSEVKMEK